MHYCTVLSFLAASPLLESLYICKHTWKRLNNRLSAFLSSRQSAGLRVICFARQSQLLSHSNAIEQHSYIPWLLFFYIAWSAPRPGRILALLSKQPNYVGHAGWNFCALPVLLLLVFSHVASSPRQQPLAVHPECVQNGATYVMWWQVKLCIMPYENRTRHYEWQFLAQCHSGPTPSHTNSSMHKLLLSNTVCAYVHFYILQVSTSGTQLMHHATLVRSTGSLLVVHKQTGRSYEMLNTTSLTSVSTILNELTSAHLYGWLRTTPVAMPYGECPSILLELVHCNREVLGSCTDITIFEMTTTIVLYWYVYQKNPCHRMHGTS